MIFAGLIGPLKTYGEEITNMIALKSIVNRSSYSILASVLLVISLIMVSACSTEDEIISVEEFLMQNNINAEKTASGLYYDIITPGDGPAIDIDKFIVIHVTQFDLRNTVIGGTTNTPFPQALAVNLLMPGLQEGLSLLKKGGKASFFVPPSLSGGQILQGALIFGIEIIEVYDSLSAYNDGEIEKYLVANELAINRTVDGIYYIIEEEGADPKPQITSEVTVHYHGYFLNGQVFDSSVERGTPTSFQLSGVIVGWQKGIPLFGAGGKGKLFIPSNLAYGAQGSSSIPSNYPIAFDVEIIEVK